MTGRQPLQRRWMLVLGSLLLWLQGCAIGTPWPRLAPATAEQAQQAVVLVITRVVVDGAQRQVFDEHNRRVLASMGSHAGLIGHAAQRELFGNQGWTMSIWASDEARAAFVQSAVHREAVRHSRPALQTVELKRLTLPWQDLPQDWPQALALLADPVGRRSYWE